jgi:hypothetical protein
MPDCPDWSGLEVTGEDNPVDGWWTADGLSVQKTPLDGRSIQAIPLLG